MPNIFSTANFNRRLSPNERQFRIAEILTRGATDTSPIQSPTQGISRLVQAFLAKGAFDDATSNAKVAELQRSNDLAQALRRGRGFVNPGVAPGFTPSGELPAGATDTSTLPVGTRLSEGDPEGMARTLINSQDTGLQNQGLSMLASRLQFDRQKELKGIAPGKAPDKGTTDEQNFERAVRGGFKGTFFNFLQAKALASQGLILNPAGSQPGPIQANAGQPKPGPSLTVLPGSRADLQGRSIAARNESNRLEALRSDPANILKVKTAEKQATLDIKNKELMPARRNDILVKTERLPILRDTIKDIKELSTGITTSGVTGQIMSFVSGSDQDVLNKKLQTVKSVVGLDELIRVKKLGATFGALSDTEMSLLISSMGALDGNLPPEVLSKTLDTIFKLVEKSLVRKKSDFAELYPGVEIEENEGSKDLPSATGAGSGSVPEGLSPEAQKMFRDLNL